MLRQKALSHAIDAAIVLKPDRLSRVGEDILVLAKEFKAAGVKLIFVKEQWDDTLQGKMVAFMLGWAAEMYVAATVEATTRAKGRLVDIGILPQGTGKGLYGYKWDTKEKRRIPLEYEAQVVKQVFTMLGDGVSCFNVARTLNDNAIPTKSGSSWHPRTIRRMATNPAYVGLTYFGRTRGSKKTALVQQPEEDWRLLPEVTPAIISRELFDRVQKIRQQDRELHQARKLHQYLLRSHIVCGYCGNPLVGSYLNHSYRYYHCRGTYPTATRGRICNALYIRADNLEEVVWGKVKEVLEDPNRVLAELQRQYSEHHGQTDAMPSLDKEIVKLKRRRSHYDTQEKRLMRLFRYGELDESLILDELRKVKEERQANEEELYTCSRTKEHLASLAKAKIRLDGFCDKVRQNLAGCSFEVKRLALDALGIQVTATPERIDIQGTIPIDLGQTPPSLLTTGQTSA